MTAVVREVASLVMKGRHLGPRQASDTRHDRRDDGWTKALLHRSAA